jgi:hypothetical protein
MIRFDCFSYKEEVMKEDKRKGEKAIPDNVEDYLNALQQEILEKLETHGWALKFVRRPPDSPPTIVIEDTKGKEIGVLEEDGAINYESGILIRDDG